jgi:hypothetical protein
MVTWTSLCVAADKHPKFKNPQTVKINGLPAGSGGPPISTEEPFISRDGRFLFFNTGKAENHKDLHFAEFIHGQWVYRGQIGPGINTGKYAEANPTMDSRYNFFYIDSNNEQMVKTARFAVTGKLHDLKSFTGVPGREIKIFAQKFHGNMGVEVSADGTMIFFSRATWGMKGFKLGKLQGSDIFLTMKKGNKYVFDKVESERIMKNINTRNLEYAAAISTDGLELFFTRLDINDYKTGRIRSKIMRSTRESLTAPFSKPEMIDAIGGSDFVEGPAISKDGRELYYHKHDGKKFKLYKVTR